MKKLLGLRADDDVFPRIATALLTPARGLVGSVVLPILGAVPDGAIILFSGGGQEDLAVGVGALAGSTIMLLTIPWSLAIIGGRVMLRTKEEEVQKEGGVPVPFKGIGDPSYVRKPRCEEGSWTSQLFTTECAALCI
eukprot:gene6552-biopygen6934